jgi:hypothetical protein
MPFGVKGVIEPPSYVEVTYSGCVTPEELSEALIACASASKEFGTQLFLADCTGMTGGHSVVDLFSLISNFSQNGVARSMKEAILLPTSSDAVGNAEFYKTACVNRGFNVRIFSERPEALKWLLDHV